MVQLHCSVSEDTLKSNYEINKNRNLPSLSKLKNSPHKRSEEINICAAGPSIRQFEKFLRISKNDIFASKTVNYLTSIGCNPRYSVSIDPRESGDKAQLNKKTNYIISSQCDPSLFDVLKNYKTYMIDTVTSKTWQPSDKCMSAGSNSTVHAILLSVWLGYNKINLFGFDCGYNKTVNDYRVNRENKHDDTHKEVTVSCPITNNLYYTTTEYIGMAEEAMKIIQILHTQKGIRFNLYGDTLLKCLIQNNINKHFYSLQDDFPVRWLKAA